MRGKVEERGCIGVSQKEKFVDIKEMQLAVYWFMAFQDIISSSLHHKIVKFHVTQLIPILNLMPCSSEINLAKLLFTKNLLGALLNIFG